MTARVRGGGFAMGAVGGLAVALLLVGVVTYLPQTTYLPQGNPSMAAKNAASGGSAPAPAASTTAALDMSTSSHVASSATTPPGAQNGASGAPAVAAGVASTTSVRSAQTTVTTTVSSPSILVSPGPPQTSAFAGSASNGTQPQQQRPASQLTALPRESIGSLVATLSPLLVGLLVAALIYSAYSRRQDS